MTATAREKKLKGKKIKLILEITFFLALLVLATIYILKDDPETTFQLLSQVSLFPLLLALGVLFLTILLDGLNITLLARLYNGKYHYFQGFINVVISQLVGVFVKTGAGILQAYTFTKQEIQSAQAASIITMNYLMFQISLIIYSTVMVIFGYPYIKDVPIDLLVGLPLYILCIIGLSVQLLILGVIFALGFWKGLHRFVLNTGVNILAKIHIIRDSEATRRKWTLQFATYRIELKRLFRHLGLVFILLGSNLLKRFLCNLIPYLLFFALGSDMNLLSFPNALFGMAYIDVISSFLNVGAPEVLFQSMFSYYLSGVANASSLASAANLLWRCITFYLPFLCGLLAILFYKGAPKRHEILANTKTIYDLELANILQADIVTQSYLEQVRYQGNRKQAPLLSQKEVDRSFKKLQKKIEYNQATLPEERDEALAKALEEQKKNLIKAHDEVALALEKQKPDQEIQQETAKEIQHQKAISLRKQKKKDRKKAKESANLTNYIAQNQQEEEE